jgi:hypothetical protein
MAGERHAVDETIIEPPSALKPAALQSFALHDFFVGLHDSMHGTQRAKHPSKDASNNKRNFSEN